ncbi:MAG: DUF3857 domain-containing protein [Flavobacteriaceae bacterium]|nr:DUF3857 domain-containing protein [Flavobacteriaceae bacterium]
MEHSTLLIPKELKENANAVVRSNHTQIEVLGTDQMVVNVDRVVTVLNKLGNAKVGAYVHYDNNSKISKLTARVYDATGKLIKKINKKKFVDVSAVDGATLYSDSRVKYLDYTPIMYPYTVHLQYEFITSSTGFLPNWSPVEGYLISVMKNTYTLYLKSGKARVKEKNFDGYNIEKSIAEDKIYFAIKNIAAVKSEALSPSLNTFKPKALVALNNFKTDGVRGYYTNWNEFGKWMYNTLLRGRDVIDGATKIKVLELVKGVEDPIERAKIVYNFMQEKTRYISVQVGIGGIQPIPASEVDNVGYGDCKGLTNYTKALLDLVGVTSYYTHIEANKYVPISFEKDFASLEQGNHVILNIPNNGNDIWLECTSQTMPFGFLGDFTDDRDALVITPEGGVIKRTASYKNQQNLQKTHAVITIDEKGWLSAAIEVKSEGIQYDRKFSIENLNKNEQIDYYKSNVWQYNNNLSIQSVKLHNNKDSIVFTENIKATIKDYGTLMPDRMLIRLNAFNRNAYVPKRYRNRKMPLKIVRGYKDVDEFVYTYPKNYKLDGTLLQPIKIESEFGLYTVSVEQIDAHKLKYKRVLFVKEGVYPKESYKKYRTFRKKVSKYDNIRIALIKK